MPAELLQDSIVTAVALGAGAFVARRVLGFVTTKETRGQGCDKCATSSSNSTSIAGRARDEVPIYPVTLIRPSRKG